MSRTDIQAHAADIVSRRAALGALAAGAAWLHGCGGGAGAAGVAGISSGGTGSFTTGTVSGLGSVIVRGVRYDDGRASVSRSDDGVVGGIRPGMVVAIQASPVVAAQAGTTFSTATAIRISYASEWVGRIDAVDTIAKTLTVLGLVVEVPAAAVIEGAATRLSNLAAGQFVEVHGYLDVGAARLVATRIEVSTTAPPAFRLSGRAGSLDSTGRTFRIGAALISYDAAVVPPAGFADGLVVRVVLASTQVAGVWPAQQIRRRESVLAGVEAKEGDQGEIEGTVTAFDSAASFSVDGLAIDASAVPATAGLALGTLVVVRGSVRNGGLVAGQVEVKPRSLLETGEFHFIGTVSNLDVLARTFSLQGESFTYGLSTPVSVPNWLTGAMPRVEVRALRVAGQWQATDIKAAA